MPSDLPRSGSPKDWMRRAQSNLLRAEQPKPEEVLWEDLCFDAQQAAEKALRAVLLFANIKFRFVHDIGELVTLLTNNGFAVPKEVEEAVELTEYAVEARYPGPFEPVTREEHGRAVMLARAVVEWATARLDA
jgi:HEPN domain-containing protein